MSTVTIIGIAASVLTGISLVPQLIKMIREKRAQDISVGMLAILFGGLGLWSWYGMLRNDWIIIGANLFSFVANLALAILAIKYKSKN